MNDFNFFSPYLVTKKERDQKWIFIIVGAIIGSFIVGSFAWDTTRSVLLNRDITNYKKLLEEKDIKEKLAEAEKTTKSLELLNKYYNSINAVDKNIKNKEVVDSKLLYDINSTLPTDVFLKSMSIASDGVQVQGGAKTRISIGEFQHNLKSLKFVQDVQVSSVNEGTANGDYSFTLKCALKDVDRDEN